MSKFVVLPAISPTDALQETWEQRKDLMYQVSCRCLGARKDGYTTDRVPFPFVLAGVHAGCGQPEALVLSNYITDCESCEEWYVIRETPDNIGLCPGCK